MSIYTCNNCNERTVFQFTVFRDDNVETFCSKCYARFSMTCIHCSYRYHISNGCVDSENCFLCDACKNEYNYVRCYGCGMWTTDTYINNNGQRICIDCHEYYDDYEIIKPYNYKPDPKFIGDGPLYLGIELEIDCGGFSDYHAEEILNVLGKEYAYCKEDGSVDEGFEIVSFPATYEAHVNKLNWKGALDKALSLGYVSHDAETCGLHIHLSRCAFGDSDTEMDQNISKFIYLFEKFWDQITRFSRRTSRQIDRWAKRYGLTDPDSLISTAKESSRYHVVNLNNKSTVEVRIFRGTLKYETFLASLQLCCILFEIATSKTIEQINEMTWEDVVAYGARFNEFTNYCNYIAERYSQSKYLNAEAS